MKRNNAGSSLVEIVVATAVMGILASAVCTSLMFGLRLNEKTDAQLKAQLAVSSAVETLMAEGIVQDANACTVSTKKDSSNHDVIDESGNVTYIESGTIALDEFPEISIQTFREKVGDDAEFPPYYKVIVATEQGNTEIITEDIDGTVITKETFTPLASVTTYIRKAVTE